MLIDVDIVIEMCGIMVVLVDYDVFCFILLEECVDKMVFDICGIWFDQFCCMIVEMFCLVCQLSGWLCVVSRLVGMIGCFELVWIECMIGFSVVVCVFEEVCVWLWKSLLLIDFFF